jgi:hypothetical protein
MMMLMMMMMTMVMLMRVGYNAKASIAYCIRDDD